MNFVYIPAEGDKKALWLNLSQAAKIAEEPDGSLTLFWISCVPTNLTGKRADVLRRYLSGRHLSDRIHPELPPIPAAQRLEARLERRGQLTEEEHWDARHKAAGGISDSEYFDRYTQEVGA